MQYLKSFPETIKQKYSRTLAPSAYSNEDHRTLFFLKQPVKLDPKIAVLKIFYDYWGTFFLIRSYFLPIIPEIGVMTQQKVRKNKKVCFNAHPGGK